MKICCTCKIEKPLDQFNNWKKAKDGKQPRCRPCQQEYGRNLYRTSERRRQQVRDVDNRSKQKVREHIQKVKSESGCVDCGNDNPIVLEFDHLNDKEFNVADMARKGHSIKRVDAEIAKCEIVCANCHRIRTHNRRNGSVA